MCETFCFKVAKPEHLDIKGDYRGDGQWARRRLLGISLTENKSYAEVLKRIGQKRMLHAVCHKTEKREN